MEEENLVADIAEIALPLGYLLKSDFHHIEGGKAQSLCTIKGDIHCVLSPSGSRGWQGSESVYHKG